jgi:hypothetical protein
MSLEEVEMYFRVEKIAFLRTQLYEVEYIKISSHYAYYFH